MDTRESGEVGSLGMSLRIFAFLFHPSSETVQKYLEQKKSRGSVTLSVYPAARILCWFFKQKPSCEHCTVRAVHIGCLRTWTTARRRDIREGSSRSIFILLYHCAGRVSF